MSCTAEAYAGRSHEQARTVWTETRGCATLLKGVGIPRSTVRAAQLDMHLGSALGKREQLLSVQPKVIHKIN